MTNEDSKEVVSEVVKKKTAPKKVKTAPKKDNVKVATKSTKNAPQLKKTAEAKLKSIKGSPIKLAALARTIKGLPVSKAVAQLTFSNIGTAPEVNKLLKSAMSNAENNFGLDIDKLYIQRVDVGKAMVLKRFTARGRGRGSRILKPFSNIRIVLAEKNN